jgi:hypothetical protein
MRAARFSLVVLVVSLAIPRLLSAQEGKAKEKKAPKTKAEPTVLDPFGRPEGSIVAQTARYYVWYDGESWHLRTTAKVGRNFHGTIRTKDARIKSCRSVGLKNDKQKKGATDAWRVNDARSELTFHFKTGQLSDGFDFVVEGEEGQLDFDLLIDDQKNPRAIFVGRGEQHPDKNPFSLGAMPKKGK